MSKKLNSERAKASVLQRLGALYVIIITVSNTIYIPIAQINIQVICI
jgi:hypothetical protein